MGHVRSRFFDPWLARASVQPPKIPPKSLFRRILPVTLTRSRFCAENVRNPLILRIRGGRGEGGTLLPPVAIELVVAVFAAAQPRPACHALAGEAGTAEDVGSNQRVYTLLAWQPLLFWRDDLSNLDRRDSDKLLV